MPMKPVILFVDANSVHVNALREALHGEEAELLCAASSAEAAEVLLTREVVLVVMAARLLQTEGFKCAETLRGMKRTRHVPLILITEAGDDEQLTIPANDAGILDSLPTPIDPRQWRRKFRMYLEVSRQRQELSQQRMALRTALDEQRGMQAQLRDEEERYRLALTATRDAVWVWNIQTDSQVWNQAGADLFGWSEVVEQPQPAQWWVDRVHPDDRERVGGAFHEAIGTPSVTHWADEYRFLKRDGTYAWVLDHGYIVRDVRGSAKRAVGAMQDITERKRAQEIAAHFAAVVGSSFDAIVSKTPEGVITSWNAAAERMFGYSASEMIDHTAHRLIPVELHAEENDILARISCGESIQHYETVRLTKDGRRVDLSLTISPIRDSKGQIIGSSQIARDITEQKRQRTALKESEELFRALVDQMSQLAWMMDDTGNVYWFNQRWYDYTGMTIETMHGEAWDQAHHPDHRARVLSSRRRSLETGEPWEETCLLRGKDGQYRWYLTRAVPIRDDQGRIVRWFGTNTDITEHKRTEEDLRTAEQALRQSDTRFRELVERSPFGIYVVDAEFRIAHMNEAGQKGAFCNVRPVIGRDFGEAMRILWPEAVAADIIKQFRHTLETGTPYRSRDFINPRADLQQTEGYEWELHRLTLPDGRHGVICYYYDSTRLRMVEAALRESGERLQAAAADLEKRVDERTRDLVRSQADLRALASELNLTEQRERKRLAGELHDHLQQMLVFGKLQLGRGMMQTGVDPECMEVIRDVYGMLSEALTYTHTLVAELCPPVLREHGLLAGLRWLADYMKRYGMKVTVKLPDEEDLALPEDCTILLFQSVRELLMNAHKYAGTGLAEVALVHGQGALMIHVRDRGKGFDSAAATSADLAVGGSSSKFGLFSIKERMRTLGGSFAIASAPGQGTTATLRLPLTSRAAEAERVGDEKEVPAGTPAVQPNPMGTRPIRVLLVDDHVMIRQGLRAVLEGYSDIELIGEAGNGEEAVALVDRLEPSVVVMDINMPKMNGIEASGRITMRHPAVAVIGLSVNASADNQSAMLKAGARQLLTKEAAAEQSYGAIKSAVGISA